MSTVDLEPPEGGDVKTFHDCRAFLKRGPEGSGYGVYSACVTKLFVQHGVTCALLIKFAASPPMHSTVPVCLGNVSKSQTPLGYGPLALDPH